MTRPGPCPVPQIASMAAYALADPCPDDWVSLAQNESAFAPSPAAVSAARAIADETALYPDPDWTALRAAIAQVHGVAGAHILCGAGSMELIGALIRAFAGPGDAVLGSAHGYLFAQTASQQVGAAYHCVPEYNYSVDTDALAAAVTPQTRIVFLCNPGNPTGTRISNGQIVALRAQLPETVLLVVDQAYAEFDDQDPTAIFDLVDSLNTVVLRTFSKAYGLAGARVGWGLFPAAIARDVRKLLNPNNVSGISQAMACAAMLDQAYMRHVVTETAKRRMDFASQLEISGFTCPESHTNFVLIPFSDASAADRADARLRDHGLLLRGMAGYGLPHCLRATIGQAGDMNRVAGLLTKGPDA